MDSTVETLLTKSELKERGWTDGAIKKYLGEPDKTSPNPYSKKASELKLFSRDRVEEIENSKEWQDWYRKITEKRERRKYLNKQRIQREKSILKDNPVVSFDNQIRREDIKQELPFDDDFFDDYFYEEMKGLIQETIFMTLKKSWWYPVDRLLFQFYRSYSGNIQQSQQKIDFLVQSILKKGWKGYPLIAWFGHPTEDPDDKEFLLSGYHRLEALKRLRKQEKIDNGFLVPVFSLSHHWEWLKRKMPKKDKKITNFTDGELTHITLKELCRHGSGFVPLVTDLDNY